MAANLRNVFSPGAGHEFSTVRQNRTAGLIQIKSLDCRERIMASIERFTMAELLLILAIGIGLVGLAIDAHRAEEHGQDPPVPWH
ncbi:MAG: hypothetical protein ACREAC_10795 [Blastocatellia bacterium]